MSSHPNVILMCRLTPDDLARKTYRAIVDESDFDETVESIKIHDDDYYVIVMEDDYNESSQISGKAGDIVLWDMVTYGYGERISWKALEAKKLMLELWADGICQRHHCTYEIDVTANYW